MFSFKWFTTEYGGSVYTCVYAKKLHAIHNVSPGNLAEWKKYIKVIYCMIQFMSMRNNKTVTILNRLVPRYRARRKQIWKAMFRILDVIVRTRNLLDCFPHLGEKNVIKHTQIHFIMPYKFMWIYNYLTESFTKKWNLKCNFKNMYFLQNQTVTFCYPCSDETSQKSQGTCLNCCWQYSF